MFVVHAQNAHTKFKPRPLAPQDAASSFVNPLTALYMVDVAKRGQHKAVIHTAAASSLGKMLLRLCLKEGVPIICVVRREEQEVELRGMVRATLPTPPPCSRPSATMTMRTRECAGG